MPVFLFAAFAAASAFSVAEIPAISYVFLGAAMYFCVAVFIHGFLAFITRDEDGIKKSEEEYVHFINATEINSIGMGVKCSPMHISRFRPGAMEHTMAYVPPNGIDDD